MLLKTSKKEYKVEFTFEAAESDIVQKAFDYFSGAYMFKGLKENGTELENKVAQVDAMVSGISVVPKLAIDLLYMGLLEYHGTSEDADGTITCREDAKRIYKEFCKENPEDSISTQYGLFEALRGQMETDGFFKRIGLEQMMNQMNQPEPKKIPQDHKKKVNVKA